MAFIFPPISNVCSGFSLFIPTLPSLIIVNTSVLILDTDNIEILTFTQNAEDKMAQLKDELLTELEKL